MARDPVEQGAQASRGPRVVHLVGHRVERPGDHLQLVAGHLGDALSECHGVGCEVVVGHHFEHRAHLQSLVCVELVAGQHIAPGVLQAEAGDPVPGGLRDAPHPAGRVPEAG